MLITPAPPESRNSDIWATREWPSSKCPRRRLNTPSSGVELHDANLLLNPARGGARRGRRGGVHFAVQRQRPHWLESQRASRNVFSDGWRHRGAWSAQPLLLCWRFSRACVQEFRTEGGRAHAA